MDTEPLNVVRTEGILTWYLGRDYLLPPTLKSRGNPPEQRKKQLVDGKKRKQKREFWQVFRPWQPDPWTRLDFGWLVIPLFLNYTVLS